MATKAAPLQRLSFLLRGNGRVVRGCGPALLLARVCERGRFWSAHRMIVSTSPILVLESSMRLTIDVDDESLTRAAALTGIEDRAAVIRHALELLIRIESGRQLSALGASDRDAVAAPRRCG